MLRARTPPLLLLLLLFLSLLLASAFGNENGFNCNCDDEGFWSVPTILECQKVSDFLIAVAYFSIPIELLYFVSFSNVPFKWVLVQFIAFIVLCGLTHLLNGWTYYGPHSFHLMLSLTIAKFLTALVSCATAITLLTLIPLLLKWKVRELFLRQNVLELDQEVGMMKKQKEASWHVRMLTREIRKSLDKHTILYTTMVELSKTLDLTNCAVWMPNENFTAMNLTHELKASSSQNYNRSIPISDPDVIEIKKSKGVVILQSDSSLATATGGGGGSPDEAGPVAAIRMPLLQVSNFKGGTPELVDTRYAILVLVLPGADSRKWTGHEMEIVEVVADQVAVALSHAAVLEESQFMREKQREKNRAFQQAKRNAMMASAARNSFQKVMSHGMRRPMHSIMGLLSILQDHETLGSEQKLLVDSMTKTSSVLSTLISDAMEISSQNDGKFRLEMRPFQLHSLIKEASCLARCLCIYKRFGFSVDVQGSLPDHVMGDESRTFQMILHMFGYLLDIHEGGGTVIFRVFSANGGNDGKNERVWGLGMPSMPGESINVKFEIEISRGVSSTSDASIAEVQHFGRVHSSNTSKDSLSFTVFRKLAQMQGKILTVSSSQGLPERMTLILPFPLQSLRGREYMLAQGNNPEQQQNILRGLNILLSDDDDINRIMTRKQLEKLGCQVTTVSSGLECLSALRNTDSSFRVVLLDLHMPDIDGFEVAMRIRKFKSRSRSQSWPLIIALTTSAEERITDKCIQAGMNGMVRKPAVLQTLADEILQALNRAGGI